MKPVLAGLRSESGRAVRSGGDLAGQAVNQPFNVTLLKAHWYYRAMAMRFQKSKVGGNLFIGILKSKVSVLIA